MVNCWLVMGCGLLLVGVVVVVVAGGGGCGCCACCCCCCFACWGRFWAVLKTIPVGPNQAYVGGPLPGPNRH